MRRVDGGVLVGLTGALALWMAGSDAILRYLRPGMRPFLLISGGVLVIVGAIATLQARGPSGSGRHRSHIGWLLVVPLCVAALMRPGPLGAYAAGRQSLLRAVDVGEFDLEQHLRAGSFAGQSPELRMMDFLAATYAKEDRALLAAQPVRLVGFVAPDPEVTDEFLLTRFTIGCCAGDALAIQVRVVGMDGAVPETDTWVEVEGTYDNPSAPSDDELTIPTMRADTIKVVDEPDSPYELP